MADVQPLTALRYDTRAIGSLDAVIAPPYDVIDDALRSELATKSPFNVVEIDLPRMEGGDPYLHAQTTFEAWRQQGILVREREPALWPLIQEYEGPDGRRRERRGFFCRVRVEDYGAGRIRPHERTQPGPKEDRLRLTRATRANLSPIFSLFADPDGAAASTLEDTTSADPFATATEQGGTVNLLWRVTDPEAVAGMQRALASAELLIADGHHRYETARVYAEEVGGDGEHRYVLMLLCALDDPGLMVFPTHRLVSGLDEERLAALRSAIERDFERRDVSPEELEPHSGAEGIAFGYIDRIDRSPCALTLRDPSVAVSALAGKPEPYRRLEVAVLEALMLRGALGMSEDDIAEKRGLDYARSVEDARVAVESGHSDAAFFLRATPVEQVRDVAAAGVPMPPKSTFFYPKVPTGLLFNPLE